MCSSSHHRWPGLSPWYLIFPCPVTRSVTIFKIYILLNIRFFTYYFVSSARIFIYSFNKSASSDAHTLITLLDVGKIRDSFSRILGNSTQLFPVLFHWVLWPQETETPRGKESLQQSKRKERPWRPIRKECQGNR